MTRRTVATLFTLCAALLGAAATLPAAAQEAPVLMMATTTSTDDTGLLDVLAAGFKKDTGIELRWTATGTGKALKLGENCDVDVLLVHAPGAEKKFVAEGFGLNRRETMYNDFVIIGPAADPAAVKGRSVQESLAALRTKQAVFVSRGDNSGTHKMEQELWQKLGQGLPEKEAWYVQTGQGMLTTINVAAERDGYTLTDRGTYIKYESDRGGNPPLKILVEGDAVLLNQYSVIEVNPAKCPKVKHDLAKRYGDWMVSPAGQKLIGDFSLLGKPLFTPNAK
jgi:tungstate transport system substrate-binding protein